MTRPAGPTGAPEDGPAAAAELAAAAGATRRFGSCWPSTAST